MSSASGARRSLGSAVVLEDDEALAATIAEAIEGAGFHPVTVRTLGEARQALQGERPDVVFLDLSLEEGFGADLLEELCDDAEAPAVVIVSGFPLAPLVAQRYGVPLVSKPFELDALVAAAEEARTVGRKPRRVGGG